MTIKQITSLDNSAEAQKAPVILESANEIGAQRRDLPVFRVYSWTRTKWWNKLKEPSKRTPWAFAGTYNECLRYIDKEYRRVGHKAFDDLDIYTARGKKAPWTIQQIHNLKPLENGKRIPLQEKE